MKNSLILVLSLFLFSSCQTTSTGDASAQKLFDDYWQDTLKHNPDLVTYLNINNDRMAEVTPNTEAFYKAQKERDEAFLLRAQETLKAPNISPRKKLFVELLILNLERSIQDTQFKSYLFPFSSWGGLHNSFIESCNNISLKDKDDIESYINRIKTFKIRKDQVKSMAQKAIAQGYLPSGAAFNNFEKTFEVIHKTPSHKSRLAEPLQKVKFINEKEKKIALARLYHVIEKDFYPEIKDLQKFWTKTYEPALRKSYGISEIPNGKAYYEYLVKMHTTTSLTADQIHKIGLKEVKRIRGEMQKIMKKVGWKKSFASFLKHLKTHPQFYAKSKKELLSKIKSTLSRMDKELPKLFGRLPKTPYEIKEIPAAIAPKAPTAYYDLPALDGSRPGIYYVNTYDLKSRPLYEVEALSFHEAVPGHHFQFALQVEGKEKPEFAKTLHFTAFGEGWGLYSEVLGKDVGFYTDPYSDFGRLSYEMWRSLRLVVDTGIHSKGWSRKKAIRFMAANSALTKQNIIAEVDRYISWPGQALAYKIGQLKILELRDYVKSKQKDQFDLKKFHDMVLKDGSVPLSVLEKNIKASVR